jgi:hypothetical protein
VGAGFRRNGFVAVVVGEDRLLADDWLLAGADEDGDRLGAGALAQQGAIVLLDRHVVGRVVDAEARSAAVGPSARADSGPYICVTDGITRLRSR